MKFGRNPQTCMLCMVGILIFVIGIHVLFPKMDISRYEMLMNNTDECNLVRKRATPVYEMKNNMAIAIANAQTALDTAISSYNNANAARKDYAPTLPGPVREVIKIEAVIKQKQNEYNKETTKSKKTMAKLALDSAQKERDSFVFNLNLLELASFEKYNKKISDEKLALAKMEEAKDAYQIATNEYNSFIESDEAVNTLNLINSKCSRIEEWNRI